MLRSMPEQPPRLVAAWEALEGGKQAVIAFPVLAVVIAVIHLTMLNQPLGRAVVYGLFWAIPATWAVVTATAHERRKRLEK